MEEFQQNFEIFEQQLQQLSHNQQILQSPGKAINKYPSHQMVSDQMSAHQAQNLLHLQTQQYLIHQQNLNTPQRQLKPRNIGVANSIIKSSSMAKNGELIAEAYDAQNSQDSAFLNRLIQGNTGVSHVMQSPNQTPKQFDGIYHNISKNDYMERLEYYQKLNNQQNYQKQLNVMGSQFINQPGLFLTTSPKQFKDQSIEQMSSRQVAQSRLKSQNSIEANEEFDRQFRQIQLLQRRQQQFGGDFPLPVISVTSTQLANMIMRHQQQQEQKDQAGSQQTRYENKSPLELKMDQMAVTIRINDNQEHQSPQFFNNQINSFQKAQGQTIQNNIFLPSLPTHPNLQNLIQQLPQSQPQKQFAPVSKVHLYTRGKSVPRSNARGQDQLPSAGVCALQSTQNIIDLQNQQIRQQNNIYVQKEIQNIQREELLQLVETRQNQAEQRPNLIDIDDFVQIFKGQNLRIPATTNNAGVIETKNYQAQAKYTNEIINNPSQQQFLSRQKSKSKLQQQETKPKPETEPQNQYLKQSGPLSDLIQTQGNIMKDGKRPPLFKNRNRSQVAFKQQQQTAYNLKIAEDADSKGMQANENDYADNEQELESQNVDNKEIINVRCTDQEAESQLSTVRINQFNTNKTVSRKQSFVNPSGVIASLVQLQLPIDNHIPYQNQNQFKGVISTRRSQASQGLSSNKSTVPVIQGNINQAPFDLQTQILNQISSQQKIQCTNKNGSVVVQKISNRTQKNSASPTPSGDQKSRQNFQRRQNSLIAPSQISELIQRTSNQISTNHQSDRPAFPKIVKDSLNTLQVNEHGQNFQQPGDIQNLQKKMLLKGHTLDEAALQPHGQFFKNLNSACNKYMKHKNVNNMTGRKYRDGISQRMFVAKETFNAKRSKLPIIIISLDGVFGYFDETKAYHFKEKSLFYLHSLSHNFRIVAFSMETRSIIRRMVRSLAEMKQGFHFDAVYALGRKHNCYRLNITHVLLDFQDENEENLDLFIQANMVMVLGDRYMEGQTWDTQDLRELFDFDHEYLTGAKSPLIIRVPHARFRTKESLIFDALFQTLLSLLVASNMQSYETASFFTYTEKTAKMILPSRDKYIFLQMLPDKLKNIEKAIQTNKTMKFVNGEIQNGVHFHKGFKMLTEALNLREDKIDWMEYNFKVYKPLIPIRQRLMKITQKALQQAIPPTGRKLNIRCKTDAANKLYFAFQKKNEVMKKHMRKYRARYWANNQIDEPAEESEPSSSEEKDSVQDELDVPDVEEENGALKKALEAAETLEPAQNDGNEEIPLTSGRDDVNDDLPLECESSSVDERAQSSEDELVDENAPPIKYKVIDLKENDIGCKPPIKLAKGQYDQHRMLKIETRKANKSQMQHLIEMCCKKQLPMMFATTQQQQLMGCQKEQIEEKIQELVNRLNEREKNTAYKEVYNYDF